MVKGRGLEDAGKPMLTIGWLGIQGVHKSNGAHSLPLFQKGGVLTDKNMYRWRLITDDSLKG
jgi:hypothetical protein